MRQSNEFEPGPFKQKPKGFNWGVFLIVLLVIVLAAIIFGLIGSIYSSRVTYGRLYDVTEYVFVPGEGNLKGYERYGDPMIISRWIQRRSLALARSDHAAVSVGDYIYLIGGTATYGLGPEPTLKLVERYNPRTNSYSTMANMPTARYRFAAAACGKTIFVIGGRDKDEMGNDTLNVVEAYDTTTNSWTSRANALVTRSDMAAVCYNNKIYVFGGYDTDYNILNTTEIYDLNSDTWTYGPSMNVPRADITGQLAQDGTIYVPSGFGSTADEPYVGLTSVEQFDIVANEWVLKEDLPFVAADAGVSMLGRFLYVVGGQHLEGGLDKVLHAVQVYDTTTGRWDTSRAVYPSPAFRKACEFFAADGRVYCFGGQYCTNGQNKGCWTYGPDIAVNSTNAVYALEQQQLYPQRRVDDDDDD